MKFVLLVTASMYLFMETACKEGHVDLRDRGLKTVPNDTSSSTQSLDLSNNLLTFISNRTFTSLSELLSLDLSYNRIERLEPLAFSGLFQLRWLNLSENCLLLSYKAYPVDVFQPLKKLTSLDLNRNSRNVNSADFKNIRAFPEKIFSNLVKLRHLSIDGLGDIPFGSGFLRMSRLTSLSLYQEGAPLKVKSVAVFFHLKVESLWLVCDQIEVGILQRFKEMKSLVLTTDGLSQTLGLLAGLGNRTFTRVGMAMANEKLGGSLNAENLVLTRNNTAHLAKMCIKQLDLSHNSIIHVSEDVFLAFRHTECLEWLDLGANYLPIASHWFWFFTLARFPNLKYINLSIGHLAKFRRKRDIVSNKTNNRFLRSITMDLQIPFPPSAEVINASYLGGRIPNLPNLTIANGSRLLTLDFAYMGIQGCSFRLNGLVNLRVFNMSGFDCSVLSPEFFTPFSSVEVLVARECQLDKGFEQYTNGILFSTLKRLQTLDISGNNLITLSKGLFQPLVSLQNLIVANNKLIHLPESILTLKSLSSLDVSSNVISSISVNEQNWFYNIQSSLSTELRLSLSENPLLCTCETLSFLHWVLSTEIYLVNNTTLSCTLESGQVTNIWNLRSQLKDMDVKCVSKFWLSFSVVGSSVLTISLILGIFGYRYRWNIKYWFLTKCRRNSAYEEVELEQYQYDAFVAYNRHDYQWACLVLRVVLETENSYTVCLHDRDFLPAESIQENIVDAINKSRKIILVISRKFLTSDWGEFEIQMAGMRMVRDGRENGIIAIMMEEIPVSEMPRSLLTLWKHVTFLIWNNDQTDEHMFWDRLLEAMARP